MYHAPLAPLRSAQSGNGEEVKAMGDRLLRRRQVEELTAMSRSGIYRAMQAGDFPRPVKIGAAAVRWRESDIVRWLESRPIARGEIGCQRRDKVDPLSPKPS